MLLRYAIVVLIIVVAIGLLLWKMYNTALDSQPKARYSETNYARAIRQLDQIITEPTLISSTKWEENTRKVIEKYYEKN